MKITEDVITAEDFPKGFWRDLAKQFGVKPYLKLMEEYGGGMTYIPAYFSTFNRADRRLNKVSHRQIKQF